MMSLGIAEIVIILLVGGLLPQDAEPLPPSQIMMSMPAQCEVMGFLDLRGIDSSIQETLDSFTSQSWLVSNPDVAGAINNLTEMIAMARSQAPGMLGFDPFTQLSSITGCLRLNLPTDGPPRPEFLMVLQGSFPSSVTGTLANLMEFTARATTPTGQTIYGIEEDEVGIGLVSTAPGIILFGTKDLLNPALSGAPTPDLTASSSVPLPSRMLASVAQGSYGFIGFQPSPALRSLMTGEVPTSAAELLAGMNHISLTSTRDGAVLDLTATNADAQRRFELLLEGVKEYSLAFNHMARAIVWGGAGLLSPNDMELEPILRQLAANRDAILEFVNDTLLSDDPRADLVVDPATMTSSLTMNRCGALQTLSGIFALVGFSIAMTESSRGPDDYGEYELQAVEPFGNMGSVCPDGTVCPEGTYCERCATPPVDPADGDCSPGCIPYPAGP